MCACTISEADSSPELRADDGADPSCAVDGTYFLASSSPELRADDGADTNVNDSGSYFTSFFVPYYAVDGTYFLADSSSLTGVPDRRPRGQVLYGRGVGHENRYRETPRLVSWVESKFAFRGLPKLLA
jgi:hypothetical protein